MRRITVQSQPRLMVLETLSQKNPAQKLGWWSGPIVELLPSKREALYPRTAQQSEVLAPSVC
jgi:hypothetical protein